MSASTRSSMVRMVVLVPCFFNGIEVRLSREELRVFFLFFFFENRRPLHQSDALFLSSLVAFCSLLDALN